MSDWVRGFTLWAFDLTPDNAASDAGHLQIIRHGAMRLEVKFREALSHAVNLLVQGEFQNLIQIDGRRNVIVDYAN